MSVRSEKTAAPMSSAAEQMATAISDAAPMDASLQEGVAFATANAENPLSRNVVISVRASLNELCLQKSKGTWAPSGEAMRSILQQKKFTSLDGAADAQGDLKAVVLHNMEILHSKSTFPMSLGECAPLNCHFVALHRHSVHLPPVPAHC